MQIFGHANKKLNAGRGVAGKVAIVGAKDRATNSVKTKAAGQLAYFITWKTEFQESDAVYQ